MPGTRPVAALAEAERYLTALGVESPRAEAETLLMHVLGTDRAGLYGRADALADPERDRLALLLAERSSGVPLQHITGQQAFHGLVLRVIPGVFVPRPETEVVVERALEVLEGVASPVAVDVGTGTGAIALSIKRARPDARVLATDRSGDAESLAAENAGRLGLDVETLRGDLLAPLPGDLRGRLDLIVSNPPYVATEDHASLPPEVRRDPYEALVGGVEVHRRLAEAAPRWLRPGGALVMEIGADQGPEVRSLLDRAFERAEVLPDLAGRDRVVRGRLSRAR
jgi:release factor glutamine methyltransferase